MEWTNPVYPNYFADPFVWKHGGKYYAVGTGPLTEKAAVSEEDLSTAVVNGREMAIPLLTSPDLIHWKLLGGALIPPPFARGVAFWAPEVAYSDGLFYLYYSCAVKGLEHQLRVASSPQPEGPYQDIGPLLPESDQCSFAIDAHPFQDDDGQWYLFYARDFLDFNDQFRPGTALVVDRLVGMTRLAGEIKTVLRARCDWQRFQANRPMYGKVFDWHTLEGPCVRQHGGAYYCTYSGGCYQGDGYGVDYGTAARVTGPYTDAGGESGARILRTVPGQVIGPGHHSIIKGPDDQTDFIVYHAWDPQMTGRRMHLGVLEWTPAGPRCQAALFGRA